MATSIMTTTTTVTITTTTTTMCCITHHGMACDCGRSMRKLGYWAEHPEVVAWAYARGRPVRVFSWNFGTTKVYDQLVDPRAAWMGEEELEEAQADDDDVVHLLYLQGHYWYVRRLEEDEEPPVVVDSPTSVNVRPRAPTQSSQGAPVHGGRGAGAGAGAGPGGEHGRGRRGREESSTDQGEPAPKKRKLHARKGLYGGRNRKDFTYRAMMRKLGEGKLVGGQPTPVRTPDEMALFAQLSLVLGTNFKLMAEVWNAKIVSEVSEVQGMKGMWR
jgi:hypothetical protein